MGFNDFNCTTITDLNGFSEIGNCIVGQTFGADYLLAGIVLILALAFLMWRGKLPLSAVLPISTVLAFGLSVVSPVFMALWLLAIVANAVMVAVGVVFTYGKR